MTERQYGQYMQVITQFPIPPTSIGGTGCIEVNAGGDVVEFIFGDERLERLERLERFYMPVDNDTLNAEVFAAMYACAPLAGRNATDYIFTLDDPAMDRQTFLALPLSQSFQCQGGLSVKGP